MPNRLSEATSPYLLQHKDNPVDWWEWGVDAFSEARRRDVPVLLSVGYAACHWCHVMAHESFEDPETARVMNESFVNVKVDREERPDVDSIYMEAVQAMTGSGGWPMTVWLDHDGRPFFSGTYFPSTPHHGMPSFRQVIESIATAWRERREEVADQAARLVSAIEREIPSGEAPGRPELEAALQALGESFDPRRGGFGHAPKFPQQPLLDFLLRVSGEAWAVDAGDMLTLTLDAMARGGIHDQVGGGFARYSVDSQWLVPHFEKMLYDNAQLARIYLWAGVELRRPDYLAVARSTLDYLERDLRHPEGGLFSSEDADSEGVEGKFYVWTASEIESALGDRAPAAMDYFGVTTGGNFEGANILHVTSDTPPPDLAEIRDRLLAVRSARVRPGLDDKVITAWNGLAIRAFAEAGAVLGDDHYLDLAVGAARFLEAHVHDGGSIARSWRDGRVSGPGFLDDHSSLAVGLFALYAATTDPGWYGWAMRLVGDLGGFARAEGGFYSTPAGEASLVKRPFDLTDNPLPSGNAMAAEALLLASLYSGDTSLLEDSHGALAAAGLLAERYPSMVGHHLAVAHSASDPRELAIVGSDWRHMAAAYWSRYRPGVALAVGTDPEAQVPLLEGRWSDRTRAFVCRGFVCDLPTSDPEEMVRQLG